MTITKDNLTQLSDYLWEIPTTFRKKMKVPARFYASGEMLDQILSDRSLEQLVNLSMLPGVERAVFAMPDMHEGYGSPIGGVFATRLQDGIISPGAVGYDENCGVRLLTSQYSLDELKSQLDQLAHNIMRSVPSGLGRGHKTKVTPDELDKILTNGAQQIVEQGSGKEQDFQNCESNGRLDWADPSQVSDTAKKRGQDQVGTLGSGNHFLEIQKVQEVYDAPVAQAFGLFKDQVVIMVHTGSRGLGHQIATDYIRLMIKVMPDYDIQLPDRELACAPFTSKEGQQFFKAMACGMNFAWANRQMITHLIRQAWQYILGEDSLDVLYDVAHNIAKIENNLIVHRKGATRAFPPGHSELPAKYQSVGQPVLIPGSMGTASYVLVGTQQGEQTFYSVCHGAGRAMSRKQAIRTLQGQQIKKDLESQNIIIKCHSNKGIAEEAPQAYKDINLVVEVVHQAGLARKVVKLKPLAVIKGE